MSTLFSDMAYNALTGKSYGFNNVQPNLNEGDLDEDYPSDEDNSVKYEAVTTARAKYPQSTHKIMKVNPDVDVNAVPNHAFTAGNETWSGTFTVHSGVLPVIPSDTGVTSTLTPGFSPLPSLASLVATSATSISATSSVVSPAHSISPGTADDATQGQDQASAPQHLSTVIIVLITIGLASLIFLMFVICKLCNRRHRRTFPTPSLPILQDPFVEKSAHCDEESLFGGKERIVSSAPNSNGLWTWTQYSQPSALKPEATWGGNQMAAGTTSSEKNTVPHVQSPTRLDDRNVPAAVNAPVAAPPQQQQQCSAITRAAKRVSNISMSIYPASPQSTQIGVAVGGASPLTADGMPVLQRNISKASTRRLSKSRRSVRYSMHERSLAEDESTIDPYDGLRTTASPASSTPTHKKASSVQGQGRARVKAPYALGSVLRASTTVGALTTMNHDPFDDPQYVLPPLTPTMKTDELRERDTRALTTALGLASPPPPSPQPTIYPDDSVTLAGERRKPRPLSQGRPQSQLMSPSTEASARLGNLMLAEFSSMASLPSARTLPATGETGGLTRNKSVRKKTDDKPPRVPSPPPMPSLAQMALAHTNPEEYADYRSPTYSIYGLYEADRKSRAPGEGGY